jgi:hypothetical protein
VEEKRISSLFGRKNAHVVFPMPGRDPFDVACRQIQREDLVPGVGRVAFALEHEAFPVRCPVAFAGPLAVDGQSPDPGEEIAFLEGWCRALLERGGPQLNRGHQNGCCGDGMQRSHRRIITVIFSSLNKQGVFSMKRVFCVLVAAGLLALAPGSAFAQSGAAGDWELSMTTPQGNTTVGLSLSLAADKVSGELSSPMGAVPVTGTATGNDVALTAELAVQGMNLEFGITARLTATRSRQREGR